MTKVLFICHGNICRSPMAEFVMKDLVDKAGLSDQFEIASAATSTEEIGNPVYPPARRKLAEHGISCEGKIARQMTRRDYEIYDGTFSGTKIPGQGVFAKMLMDEGIRVLDAGELPKIILKNEDGKCQSD